MIVERALIAYTDVLIRDMPSLYQTVYATNTEKDTIQKSAWNSAIKQVEKELACFKEVLELTVASKPRRAIRRASKKNTRGKKA